MCGIAGYLGDYEPAIARRMAARIRHRGPDDEGYFFDEEGRLGLAHRRLAILDVSAAGHQPMRSHSGRYVICYNGEVYNYPELRRDLEGCGVTFRSRCDTEAIVELFEQKGVSAFQQLNGIFALAIWDARERELYIARDGFGVKPLYLTRTPSGIAFASEIKALIELPDLDRTLDPVAAAAYLSYLWSPGARTMFRAVEKMEPGRWCSFRRGRQERGGSFYRIPGPIEAPSRSDAEYIAGTRAALKTAVERQMLSDVEVGAFLSGGLDSSAIVAFAREHSQARNLRCFTIDYGANDEEAREMVSDLPFARRAAAHLGVELEEVRVDASMAEDFERQVYQLDEPEADPAALNSLYIAGLARRSGIQVLLSGTGGDDIFSGYRRHKIARLDRLWGVLPSFLREGLSASARHIPVSSTSLRRAKKVLEGASGTSDYRLTRLFEWLSPEASATLFADAESVDPQAVRAPLLEAAASTRGMHPLERVLRLDQRFFLIDHNLNYADKTGMAEGVEIRVPFLDRDLVAWAAALPVRAKYRAGQTKWVLRKAMEPDLPREVIYRPKTGFGVPLRSWLGTTLRPLAEELLSPATLSARGLFEPAAVRRLLDDTYARRRDGSYTLLGLMAIELWCRRFLAAPGDIRVAA